MSSFPAPKGHPADTDTDLAIMPAFLRHLFTLPRPLVIRWGGWIGAIFILAGIALPVAGFLAYRTIHHGVRSEHQKVQKIAPEYLRASGSFDELLARAIELQETNEKQYTGMLDLTAKSLWLTTGSFFFIALFGVAILCARNQAIKERALEQALRERKDPAPSGDATAD